MNNNSRKQFGVTLIELSVAIAIVAILTQIAVPSLVSSTQRMRLIGHAASLSGTFGYARSEAIKRGQRVSVCASATGTDCLTTNIWENGWIVFTDPAGNGTVGTILKVQKALGSADTLRPSASISILTFNPDGFAQMASGTNLITFTFHTAPVNNVATQCVAITNIGRLTTQATGVGNCS